MRNWTIIGLIILVLGVAALGYYNIKQSQDLNNSQADVAALQAKDQSSQKTISDLQSSVTVLNTNVSTLQGAVTALQNNSPQTSATPSIGSAMVNLIPQIEPVVARIEVSGSGFKASGSGIVIRKDGYVLTNQHVIDSANSISVTFKDGQKYAASVQSSDADLDLAILKVSGNFGNLPEATLGTTSDIVIGVSVVAAGFPIGLDLPGPASFSRGIVSARRILDGQTFIQTDATINPGSSGGGLFTLDDKLIGITSSAVLPPGQEIDGIGLAIPVDVVQSYIADNLK